MPDTALDQEKYAEAFVLLRNVTELKPHWTEEQAIDWLQEHEDAIAEAMFAAGEEAICEYLAQEGDDDGE